MPFSTFKKLFPQVKMEQLTKHKDKSVIVQTYDKCISQLWVHIVSIRHRDKQKVCRFFVVPGNGLVLLGKLDIKLLHILSVKCSKIDLHIQSRDINEQQKEK